MGTRRAPGRAAARRGANSAADMGPARISLSPSGRRGCRELRALYSGISDSLIRLLEHSAGRALLVLSRPPRLDGRAGRRSWLWRALNAADLEAGLRRWPRSSASIRGHAEQSRSGLCAAEFSATMSEIGEWLDANRHQLTRYKYDHTDEAFAMRFDGIYCSFPQPASADPRSRRCRPSIRR